MIDAVILLYTMMTQPEQFLENQLVEQLQKLGYAYVAIKDEKDLLANLKRQLERHNMTTFTDKEFDRVLNILSKGTVFEKARILREKQHITRDNGESLYFAFIEQENWCQNGFQVTHQKPLRDEVLDLIDGKQPTVLERKKVGDRIIDKIMRFVDTFMNGMGAN